MGSAEATRIEVYEIIEQPNGWEYSTLRRKFNIVVRTMPSPVVMLPQRRLTRDAGGEGLSLLAMARAAGRGVRCLGKQGVT